MGLIVKAEGGKTYDPIPEGVHVAVCYSLVDLGTQHNRHYDKYVREVMVTWELPHVRAEFKRDGTMVNLPRAISNKYTQSLHKKASLRKDLEAWRGKAFTKADLDGFDMKAVLGAACQLQVIHNTSADGEKVYSNVKAIMGLPGGMEAPKSENPLVYFSFDDCKTDELPADLPTWLCEIIAESKEYGERKEASNRIPEATNEPEIIRDVAPAGPEQSEPPAGIDPVSGEPEAEENFPF